MLVEFRVKNYRSFRDEQVLSLVAAKSDNSLPDNCIEQDKHHLLKSAAVYGANASGKSNLIKAIKVMRKLVVESANFEPDGQLPIAPFLLDDKSKNEPSTFEVTFYHEGIRYQYGFSASSERIEEEWLYAFPKGRAQTWYTRTYNKNKKEYDWNLGNPFLKGQKQSLREKTRDNALFLSVAAQWNQEQLTNVYKWFRDRLRVVPSKEDFKPVTARILLDAQKGSAEEKNIVAVITEILQKADMGINNIEVSEKAFNEDKIFYPEKIPVEIKKKLIESVRMREFVRVNMIHHNTITNESILFPLKEESDGTQRFFQLIGPWLEALAHGYTVFIDEFETSLHPLLTRELVKFIQSGENNRNGAQLVFATHDTTLLDPELFRRDQIWFTEKDSTGATKLYSMSDYKGIRKGEAMQKGYLSGRYGAIPILEAFEKR